MCVSKPGAVVGLLMKTHFAFPFRETFLNFPPCVCVKQSVFMQGSIWNAQSHDFVSVALDTQ